jgi:hypothetical protein
MALMSSIMPAILTKRVNPVPLSTDSTVRLTLYVGMDMLEARKEKHIVAPGLNWLIATLQDAEAFGYTHEKAEQVGYKKELEHAIRGLREMHRRGIVVLPGGDYGQSIAMSHRNQLSS